jgi:hypothetical protein
MQNKRVWRADMFSLCVELDDRKSVCMLTIIAANSSQSTHSLHRLTILIYTCHFLCTQFNVCLFICTCWLWIIKVNIVKLSCRVSSGAKNHCFRSHMLLSCSRYCLILFNSIAPIFFFLLYFHCYLSFQNHMI